MAITTATSQQTTNATTSVVTLPASVASGDMLLALLCEDSGAASNTWTAGWTELLDSVFQSVALAAAAYKIAAGGETSVTATHTTERSNHIGVRIPAAEWANDGTAPVISTIVTNAGSNAPDPGSVTIPWAATHKTILIAVAFWDDSTAVTVSAFPSGYTDNQVSNVTATSAGDVAMAVKPAAAVSSPQDPGAFTLSGSEQWGAVVIAVKGLLAPVVVTPPTTSLTIATFAPVIQHLINGASPTALAITTFAPVIQHKVDVPTTALTIATFAPTVTATQNQLLVPGVTALTLSTFAPVLNTTVTPATTALTITTFAPTIVTPVTVTPGVTALTIATFAPTVATTANVIVTPDPATLSVSSFAPTVTAPALSTPDTTALVLTTFAPVVSTPVTVTPDPASLTTATYAPQVATPRLVTPDTTALSIAGLAPSVAVTAHVTVVPDPASLSVTGFSPSVTAGDAREAVPATAALTITTYEPTVTASAHVTVVPGVVSVATSTFAPVVSATANVTVVPSPAALSIQTLTASVVASDHRVVTPGVRSLVLATFDPSVVIALPSVPLSEDVVVTVTMDPGLTAIVSSDGSADGIVLEPITTAEVTIQ